MWEGVMSRRDTIIIAVLVNAGLLMVLFATALKSDKKEHPAAVAKLEAPVVTRPVVEPIAQLSPTPVPELVSSAVVPTLAPQVTHVEQIPIQEKAPVIVLEKPAPVQTIKQVAGVEKSTATKKELNTIVVKKGDVLDKIARAHGTSVAAIMKENQLTTTELKIGQVLRLPASQKTETIAQAAPAPTPAASEYYIVKEGDNPWLIASKNHIKLEELLKMNGLDSQSARRLRPGDRLKIR